MADPKLAVLVHHLPSDFLTDALSLIPSKYIGKVEHDEEAGLKIYFKKYAPLRECIIQRNIHIQGSQYTICPLVTNLTLHGIRKYASKLTIRDIMTPYGRVIDLYPVEEISKEGNFETKSLTDDYRVVLGVPEVQIDFTLSPLQLPDLRDHCFDISFFCRLCRQNGHIQLQCSETFHCSVSQKEVLQNERQRSCTGKGCCESSKEKVRCSSNRQNGLQVSNEKTSVKMDTGQVRVLEEQIKSNFKSNDKFGYSQAEIKHTHPSESFSFESQNGKKYIQHEHATQVNVLDRNAKDASEPSPMLCEVQDASHTPLHENFTSRTSFGTDQLNMTCECVICAQERKMSRRKNKPSKPNNLPKSSDTNMWSRITPPNSHPEETKRLLKRILKTKILNVSPKVERKLQELLEWNHGREEKYLKENDRKFIKWLELYLAEISRHRIQSGHSEGEQVYQPQNTTDDQISNVEMKKKRQGVLTLCRGIEEIVLKTHGVLEPNILCNFLNQVRGRKKQMEIAAHFEKDFFALSNQLKEVEKFYYMYGKRGAREDRDIYFINRLQKRLMQESTAKKEQSCPRELSSFDKQSNSKRIISQSNNSKNQNNINHYNQSEAQTSSLEMAREEYPVEARKYSRGKKFPSRGQSSRILESSPEFCSPKSSEKEFQSNPQRFSLYDRNCFKHSSTERKHRKNFRWTNKNEIPAEIRSRRILDGKKPSRFRNNPGRKFEMNFSSHSSRCTSDLNDSISNDSLEASGRDENDKRKSNNKRSRYIPSSSTSGKSLTHHKRSVLVNNPTTESRNVERQPSSAEELTVISKTSLQEILSCAQQSDSAEELSKITKEHLRQILSCANQSTEHS